MIKYSICFKNTSFNISESLAKTLKKTKNKLLFKTETLGKCTVFIFKNSDFSFLKIIETTSETHFYIFILEKKYRISKNLFNHLNICSNMILNKNDVKQKKGWLDKFYTKPKISKFCVDVFTSNILIQKQDLIVEPSAGGGSFIKPLKEIKCGKVFIDIAPENSQINQINFLA